MHLLQAGCGRREKLTRPARRFLKSCVVAWRPQQGESKYRPHQKTFTSWCQHSMRAGLLLKWRAGNSDRCENLTKGNLTKDTASAVPHRAAVNEGFSP